MIRIKNIPEESRDRLHLYLKTQSQQIASALNDALNLEIELEQERPGVATVEELGTLINSQGIVSRMGLTGVDRADLYIVADVATTHVMNGVMILTPADVIQSSIEAGEISENDVDTFGEMINRLMDAINQTFENIVSSDISAELKGTAKSIFKPGIKSLPNLPAGEYLVIGYSFQEDEYPKVTFYVLLPRSVGEAMFDCSLEPVIDWRDRTIVVVFDTSDDDRTVIRKALEEVNIGVADFANHRDILRSLSKEDVNLVIMEITPSNWDSLMISKQIRKSTQTMNIPIIFTMKNPSTRILYLAYKNGVRNFLVKPIEKDILLEKVRSLIDEAA